MAAQVKSKTGYVDVEGGKLYYEEAGGGHPLLLIHAGVANLDMWDGQVPVFAEKYRVIRYDAREYGRTTTEAVSFSNRQDVYDLLKHLGVEKAYVLGLSRGGQIATDFTLEHPEMVDALIPVAAGLGGLEFTPTEEEAKLFNRMDELWEKKEFDTLIEIDIDRWADGPQRSREEGNPGVQRRLREMLKYNYTNQPIEPTARPLEPPAAGRLGEIKVPTLVIVGDLDMPSVLQACDLLAKGIEGAKKVVIPGTAHMVNMEKPEEFNRVVMDFLNGLP
jgi:pimeloyl-ACP methyl ester carboxylesterase